MNSINIYYQMPKKIIIKYLLFFLAGFVFFLPSCFAAGEDAQAPYSAQKINEEMRQGIGESKFEEIDPVTGSLKISHQEIHLNGNGGLDINVYRVYEVSTTREPTVTSLPNYNFFEAGFGWRIFAAPEIRVESGGLSSAYPPNVTENALCLGSSNWRGEKASYTLIYPSGGSERMIPLSSTIATTKNGWKLSCNAGGYILQSPRGMVYEYGVIERQKTCAWLDEFECWHLSSIFKATKVTDTNGNYLNFAYSTYVLGSSYEAGYNQVYRLKHIVANDGRAVELNYSAPGGFQFPRLVSIVTSAGTSWQYFYKNNDTFSKPSTSAYQSGLLQSVLRPDDTSWVYDYGPYVEFNTAWLSSISQENEIALAGRERIRSVKSPRGGMTFYDFKFYTERYQKTWLIDFEWAADPEFFKNQASYVDSSPPPYDIRLSKKTTSDGAVWTYQYNPSSTAGAYDITTVNGPDGITKYSSLGFNYVAPHIFNSDYQNQMQGGTYPVEGALCGGPGFSGPDNCYSNTVWRLGLLMEKSINNDYKETYTYSRRVHSSLLSTMVRSYGSLHLLDGDVSVGDVSSKVVVSNGATYVTSYSNYDAYGNPGTIIESGPNGGNRTRNLSYYSNVAKNIVGIPKNDFVVGGVNVVREFNDNGRKLSESRDGVVTRWTYTPEGDIETVTKPGNNVFRYANYKRGIPQTEIQPEGINLSRVVNDAGFVMSETDGESHTISFGRDGAGRITRVDYPLPTSAPMTVVYSPNSYVATRGSVVTEVVYDGFGRVASSSKGGIAVTSQYDAYGRKTFESNPNSGLGTSVQYDALGRVKKNTNADGTFSTVDYGPATKTVTNERGKATTFAYRSYGNPAEQHLLAINAAEASANVSLTRTPKDQVETVAQNGQTRIYGYNQQGYLISVQDPETGTTVYGRDDAGNMTSRRVGGSGTTTFAYDGHNRLKTTTYPGTTPAVSQTYTKTHKLKTLNNSVAQRTYSYDTNDNLTLESVIIDGQTLSTGYGYDAVDYMCSTTYPMSGRSVFYAPDVQGRPTQVSGFITNASYWPSGQMSQLSYANGTTTTYNQHSQRLWPTSFTTQKGTSLYLNSSYSYDGMGNLKSVSDTTDANYSRTLDFDGIDRLTNISGPWGGGTIGYTGGGNISSQVLGSSNLYYSYDSTNRLTSVSGNRSASYTYDVYGNIASDGSNSYTYDDVPSLRCVNCSNSANKIEYAYDGLNQRSLVTKAGVKSYEIYGAHGNQLAEYIPSQSKLTEYIYLGTKRIAQRVTTGTITNAGTSGMCWGNAGTGSGNTGGGSTINAATLVPIIMMLLE